MHHVSSDDGLDIQPLWSAVVQTTDRCSYAVDSVSVYQGLAMGEFFFIPTIVFVIVCQRV